MRISVSHGKSREEAMKMVDQSVDQLLGKDLPVQVSMGRRHWSGSTLHFEMTANLGIMKVPVHGTVEVTDADVIVIANLPRLLTAVIPEKTIQEKVERRVRGLLT